MNFILWTSAKAERKRTAENLFLELRLKGHGYPLLYAILDERIKGVSGDIAKKKNQ